MESERRKRQVPNGDSGRRTRARSDDGAREASEDEVEEFFAILRRMHAATRYLGDGKGSNGRELTEERRWRPAFEWEDFEGANAVKSAGEDGTEKKGKGAVAVGEKKGGEEKNEENLAIGRLDLNTEPEPEHAAHYSG